MIRFISLFLLSVGFINPVLAQQGRPVVGIVGMEAAAQNISCDGWQAVAAAQGRDCNVYLSEGFRVMLETAFVKSNKMDVIERTRMNQIVTEQGLGQIGLTNSGGQIGGLTGVDYLVYGAITKFGAKQSGFALSGASGIGSLLGGAAGQALGGGISTASVSTEMAVDIRVTDVQTGQIVLADTIEGEAKTGESFSFGGITTAETGADPFADVQRIVAAKLSEAVVTTSIPFKVIQVQSDGTLILNYGNAFLTEGDVLALFEVGEQFVDPDTGEVLGSEEFEIGLVEIVSAESRFSRARVVTGQNEETIEVPIGSVLKRSDVAVSQSSKRRRSGGSF